MTRARNRQTANDGPVCDRCGRASANRYRFCPDCELFVCDECWDGEHALCLSCSRPNLPAPGLMPIAIRNTIGQRSGGVSLSASRAGRALVGPGTSPPTADPAPSPTARARPRSRRVPSALYLIVAVSLLVIAALFAFPVIAQLLAPSASPSTVPTVSTPTGSQAPSSSRPTGRKYVVRPGDTLRSIAARVYGSEGRWAEIYRANRQAIPNPDALPVGATLTLP